MKRQKQYTSREMIEKDIDLAYKKHKAILAQAESCAASMNSALRLGATESFRQFRNEYERLNAKANRIQNTRLKRLQNTLAAFLTKPMFGGEAVVLQRV